MVEFSYQRYTLQESKTIGKKFFVYGELVANGRYFSPVIENLLWYVTPIEVNIKIII